MARYLGPKHRNCRRFGIPICGSSNCPFFKKNYPPGQKGAKGLARRKLSDYGVELAEKQKAKAIYGVLERQFKRYFEKAATSKANTGEKLLQLLETRLDNLVYRLGFAKTRRAARQLVSHGHILVNGKKVNIPSYQVEPDDVISLKPQSLKIPQVEESLKLVKDSEIPIWLERKGPAGKLKKIPQRAEIGEPVTDHLIVQYYSR